MLQVKKPMKMLPKRYVAIFAILSMVAVYFQGISVQAAALTSLDDTMTRIKTSETADHSITWTLPTGVSFDASDQARVTFPSGFTVSTESGWVAGDFTFNDGTSRTIVAVGASPSCSAGANNVTVAIDATNRLFTITACTSYTSSSTAANVTFTIDGTSTDGTLTNPGTTGSKKIDIVGDNKGDGFGANDDTGSLAIAIVSDEQVVVSATVDPSITFALSANTINLGTLSASAINTASHTIQTVTNALSGYSTTIVENNNLRIDVSNDIDDAAGDNDIDLGSEEYGVATSDTGQQISNDSAGNCSSPPNPKIATAVTGTAKTIAGATAPANETSTICYAASITGTTPAGSYTHTVTFISTGNF